MILIHRTIEFLLYPPGNLLVFLFIGLLFFRKSKLKPYLWFIAIAQLLLFSTPFISNKLLYSLESKFPPQAELWKIQQADAIVVLGGGRNDRAIEYGGITVSNAEMERLRYAALLHRESGTPILVSGGDPIKSGLSEAKLMAQVLKEDFGITARWIEGNSHTTWENAEFSDAMLSKDGIKSAWLVTHAWHMPQSIQVFKGRKVSYLPASHSYGVFPWDKKWMLWMPQATALARSGVALHEWFGALWYKLTK